MPVIREQLPALGLDPAQVRIGKAQEFNDWLFVDIAVNVREGEGRQAREDAGGTAARPRAVVAVLARLYDERDGRLVPRPGWEDFDRTLQRLVAGDSGEDSAHGALDNAGPWFVLAVNSEYGWRALPGAFYVGTAVQGDAGFWDEEDEEVAVKLRAAYLQGAGVNPCEHDIRNPWVFYRWTFFQKPLAWAYVEPTP
jgi:hypothetical protein